MNGVAEQEGFSSDLHHQQTASRIWDYADVFGYLCIILKKATEGGLSTPQLCQHILTSQDRYTDVGIVKREGGSECSDSDLKALGLALHNLQHLHNLSIFGDAWTDKKASILLCYAAKSSIRKLGIRIQSRDKLRIPAIMAELNRGATGLSSLQLLVLYRVELDDSDCGRFDQVLQCQRRQDLEILFDRCTFPSVKGYLLVADAAIKTGHLLRFENFCSVSDASVPDSASDSLTIHEESQCVLYNMYERLKDQAGGNSRGKDLDDSFVRRAVQQHMDRFNALNRAGRLKLLSNDHMPTGREWLEVLCHNEVRCCVDYLFHIITMNPSVYAAAAAAVGNHQESDTNNKGDDEEEKKEIIQIRRQAFQTELRTRDFGVSNKKHTLLKK